MSCTLMGRRWAIRRKFEHACKRCACYGFVCDDSITMLVVMAVVGVRECGNSLILQKTDLGTLGLSATFHSPRFVGAQPETLGG